MAGEVMVVSAPGKVILHGEHAVVYGKAALATSVDLRCYVILKQVAEAQMEELKKLAGITSESPPATQNTATLVFLYLLTHICGERLSEFEGLRVAVLSTLPASAGLGSSAAFSVSLAASLLSLMGEISNQQHNDPPQQQGAAAAVENRSVGLPQSVVERLNKMEISLSGSLCVETGWSAGELEVINGWGLKAERLIHGTPSGIDNSISTFGGAIRFCSGEINRIQRMPKVRILLVNTKVARSTKKMVAGVRDLHDKYHTVVGPILDSVEAIVEKAESLLHQLSQVSLTQPQNTAEATSIHTSLQDLCEVNQHLLNALGVGHRVLDQVCAVASARGLAAKLTGAGGGGCAFILLPPDYPLEKLQEVMEALSRVGFESWETTIGSAGVTAHNCAST